MSGAAVVDEGKGVDRSDVLVGEMKTVYSEKKYVVNVKDFRSTPEIDQVIERVLGRNLKLTQSENPLVNLSF